MYSQEAESMYFINGYGNDGTKMSTVTIKKGTQFAIGRVSYGTGTQIFIPTELQEGNLIYSNVVTPLK